MKNEKVIIVLPAYNAEATLKKTIAEIPKSLLKKENIILVDDCSKDKTVSIAKKAGLKVIVHKENKGYGGNQKTCYREALKKKADIVIMLHPDYQYDPRILEALITPIRLGICDVMLGNRIRNRKETIKSGMPIYKYLSNRLLTIIENVILGQNLGEFHSGLRAYNKKVLKTIPLHKNSDDFVFDTQFLVQAVYHGFRIGDIPVPVRYMKEASSISFSRSLKYGLQTLWILIQFILHKLHLQKNKL